MVGSKDLLPSNTPYFPYVFFNNQFRAKPVWPAKTTNLSDQTAIVTGSNTGLGYEAAHQLLELKLSRLILAVRSIERGNEAAAKLREQHPKATIEVWQLDMSLYSSIQAFAQRVESELPRLDIVLLNAGGRKLEFTRNKSTGHEETIQVNYLSTILLATLLLPILKAKKRDTPARLTIVSAGVALAAKFPNKGANPLLPSFDETGSFDPQDTYNTSKLLGHMWMWKAVDHISPDDVIVNLADCAWVKGTELFREAKGGKRIGIMLFEMLGRTPRLGASCFVDAIVNHGTESHGCFLMSWQIHPFAALLYSPEGKLVIDRLWDETLAELDFADVRGILKSMEGPR